jgi:hypothetical protein
VGVDSLRKNERNSITVGSVSAWATSGLVVTVLPLASSAAYGSNADDRRPPGAGIVENCQVGVFAGLGRDEHKAITDFRLYLPESWAGDEDRCRKAKIPEEHRVYQPKWRQALDMVKHARHLGLR